VAAVPQHELLNLAQLYLWTDQDTLAQLAIDRLLRLEATDPIDVRSRTLELLSTSLLDARPTRLVAARKYLAQLDALGPPAGLWRLLAHTEFAQYAMTIDDITTAITDARAALAASMQMSQDDRIDWVDPILFAYQSLAEPLGIQAGGPAVLALFDTINTDLLPLRPAGSREAQALKAGIASVRAPFTLFGTLGKPLTATHWYNIQGDSARRPRLGRVSLLVFVDASCGGWCYPTYATIRRLMTQYAHDSVDVIFLTSTHEYFRNHPMPSAVAESDSTANYLIHFLDFPVPVAVEKTQFSRLHDGRLRAAPTPNGTAYDRGRTGVLVDQRGIVVLVDWLQPDREKVWSALIRKALQ
jgi:hypothetical protein